GGGSGCDLVPQLLKRGDHPFEGDRIIVHQEADLFGKTIGTCRNPIVELGVVAERKGGLEGNQRGRNRPEDDAANRPLQGRGDGGEKREGKRRELGRDVQTVVQPVVTFGIHTEALQVGGERGLLGSGGRVDRAAGGRRVAIEYGGAVVG